MTTARIEITSFTAPYCSWCWATEPMLYRIRETYREQVHIRYVMGGLVHDMADFYDRPVESMCSEIDALAAQRQVEKLPALGGEFWTLSATRATSGAHTAAGAVAVDST